MLEGAKSSAHFRLVIVDGKAYVERFRPSIERDVFTLWGILQLLRVYPGKLPDLELMFDCFDRPVIPKGNAPPPLFRYCSDQWSSEVVFPDWSFWGWAEINIKPWRDVLKDIIEGSKKTKWKDREPYAYWKGNPKVADSRKNLLTCNVTEQNDWNTHLYIQDWEQESSEGYKKSNLGDQCTHSRGMVPLKHYWPIKDDNKCPSLKFAVEWGNTHTQQAQAIGEAASKFIQEEMEMDYVYDYMFHLLNGYAKLLNFKPTIPSGAVELCTETMACGLSGTQRRFMEESMVKSPSDSNPCIISPPFDPVTLHDLLEEKANSTRQVETWEDQYWKNKNKGE
ncbi:hypothetical protein RJT34_15495 [Clitoria ternatea]|uniref:Glycosyl transferase CAP10 domain-containing protein n=1 Tax=Clitoria ternatea TaxID=43366 RepID=A0AAN9J8F5_CLITE